MESEIGTNESVSGAVRRAVSAVEGRKPASLQPLSDVIDPNGLDAHFDPQSTDGLQTDGPPEFTYSNCHITIDNSESLTIEQLEPTDRQSAQSDETDRAERRQPNRETEDTTIERTPGSRICSVCQQPIDREALGQARGELVHEKCHAEARCGISLERRANR